jgi:hypothetical protein
MSDASGSLGISIPLADDLLGLKGSGSDKQSIFKQSYDAFCSSNYYSTNSAATYKLDISKISSDLLVAWTSCVNGYLKLQDHGVFASYDPIGNLDQFLADVQIKDDLVGKIQITSIDPDSVTCTHAGTPVKMGATKIDSKHFSLTCNKNPLLSTPFQIETSNGTSNSFTVPAASSKITELSDQLTALQGQLSTNFSQTKALIANQKKQLIQMGTQYSGGGPPQAGPFNTGDRSNIVYVQFPVPFSNTPQVAVSISREDLNAPPNIRLLVEADSITSLGFNLKIMTWADSELYSTAVQWIAVGDPVAN